MEQETLEKLIAIATDPMAAVALIAVLLAGAFFVLSLWLLRKSRREKDSSGDNGHGGARVINMENESLREDIRALGKQLNARMDDMQESLDEIRDRFKREIDDPKEGLRNLKHRVPNLEQKMLVVEELLRVPRKEIAQ